MIPSIRFVTHIRAANERCMFMNQAFHWSLLLLHLKYGAMYKNGTQLQPTILNACKLFLANLTTSYFVMYLQTYLTMTALSQIVHS